MEHRYFYAGGSGWQRVRRELGAGRLVKLFFDYDGTLVPIRKTPQAAVPSASLLELLKRIALSPCTDVSLVTGRALRDIRAMLGVRGITYIANHGFQVSAPGYRWEHPEAAGLLHALRRIRLRLDSLFGDWKGVVVEDKRFTLSVHYRLIEAGSVGSLSRVISAVVNEHQGLFRVTKGKKVLEIRPNVPWDKGRAVLTALESAGPSGEFLAVYFGDDRTDEDAFNALRRKGVTVRVGRREASAAQYFVKDTREVHRFLRDVAAVAGGRLR
jgi:trehalose 6-phosphate phosphatase